MVNLLTILAKELQQKCKAGVSRPFSPHSLDGVPSVKYELDLMHLTSTFYNRNGHNEVCNQQEFINAYSSVNNVL